MKLLHCILFSYLICFCFAQQTGQTFIVKKRAVENKREFPIVFDLRVGTSRDTICSGIFLDLNPIQGYYDSISLFNLKKTNQKFGKNKGVFATTSNNGHAIITFYKKEKDGTFKMIYFRNWVIHCLDKYLK